MLDVHPPHQATHTWRDFFIHVATICVGLLIAIGLEQTVEALHHSHQRHQLQEDLHGESERVHAALQQDLHTFAVERVWMLALRQDVDTMRASGGKIKLPYRPRPAFDPDDPTHTPMGPRWPPDGVWQTARESSLVGLLPRQQAEIYSSLAFQHQFFADATSTWVAEQTKLISFEMRFDDGQPGSTPDLSRMSPAELEEYYVMLTHNLALRDTMVNRIKIYDAAETAVLNGATTKEALGQRILQQHLDLER
jgi:hypothetical protein